MRIVMVTSWDRHCGIYTYSRPLVEEMRGQGHEVHVVCHTDAREAPQVHPAIDLSRPDWTDALEAEVATLDPDVVHVQFEYGLFARRRNGLIQAGVAEDAFDLAVPFFRWKQGGRPVVVTMHSDNEAIPSRLAYIDAMGRLVGATIVHTPYAARPSGDVRIIPHMAPPRAEFPGAKERYGYPGRLVVGMVGYPEGYKRYDWFVNLWPEIAAELPQEALLVAACAPRPGSAEGEAYAKQLQDAIAASPRKESILYLPVLLDNLGFFELVASFDVLALPYSSAAASGPCMAASAVGTPVVVSAVGGLRSYVESSGAGLMVEPADAKGFQQAVVEVMCHDGERRELAEKAARYAEEVSVEKTAERHISLYQEVVDRQKMV